MDAIALATGVRSYLQAVNASISWSATGGDNLVTLWKQNLLGDWEQIGQLSEDGNTKG